MRVERDKSKAGSHPPARRASIHVALNVNRTDGRTERERAAKSKSFRATVSHGQIEDSKSKGHPSFHLFQSGHWPIATADSLSHSFSLSLSCGEKAAYVALLARFIIAVARFPLLGAAAVVFSFVSSHSSLRRSFVHPHISTSITAWSMVMFMFRKVTPFGGGGGGGRLS